MAAERSKIEIVRAAVDAWSDGEWDRAFELTTPDVVVDNSKVQGEWRGVHEGREQFVLMLKRFSEPWESVRLEVVEDYDAGSRLITLVLGHFQGREGIELTIRVWMCWAFRDGLLSRILISNELEDALAEAELDALPAA